MILRYALSAALLFGSLSAAHAATLSATLSGDSLSVDSPCARMVTITPDAALHGEAVIQASAEHQEEIDHLLLESNRSAQIRTRPGRCFQEERDEASTLTLAIRVPAGWPLSLDEAGAGHYSVGAVGAALSVDLSGAGSVTDEAATTLQIDISGSGSVQVGRADGAARVEISGHGDVTVAHATMPTLSADLSGTGHLAVSDGHVAKVNLETSGAGGIAIGAEVDDAHVDLSGVGAVRFAKVNGALTKDVSGVGSVTVGQ